MLRLFAPLAVVVAVASVSHAAFVSPTSWTRPTTSLSASTNGTTYQEWQRFDAVAGPNTPNDGFPGDDTATGALDGVFYANPNGTTTSNAFDSASATSGSFLTGGGNIYSFSGLIKPRVTLSSSVASSGSTEFLINVRSLGNPIATTTADAILVNGVSITTLPGFSYTQLFFQSLGDGPQFGGALVDHAWTFRAPIAATYQLDFGWASESSSSLEALSIDTHTVVPEPTLLSGFAAAGLLLARRRRA